MEISAGNTALTKKEKTKLIRNLVILLIFDLLCLSFIALLLILYHRIDLISIIASLLATLLFVLIAFYASKYIRDLKGGVADIYSGIVKSKEEDEAAGESVGSQYLYIEDQRFQVSFLTYLKVKENDHVTIRKAPVSNCTLSVTVNKKEEPEN